MDRQPLTTEQREFIIVMYEFFEQYKDDKADVYVKFLSDFMEDIEHGWRSYPTETGRFILNQARSEYLKRKRYD